MSDDVRNLFHKIWETSEGFRTFCPRCGDTKGVLKFNESKGVGCCFHSDCPWFYERGGVTTGRLQAYLSKQSLNLSPPEVIEKADDAEVTLPEEFELLDELPSSLGESIFCYLEHRSLTRKILRLMKVGYCQSGKFWGYIIFPVFDEARRVIYWQGRRFKKREPKFYNPAWSHKSDILYWVGKAKHPRKLILVESIINALTLDSGKDWGFSSRMVAAILGKSLSETQRDKLFFFEKWLSEVTIALDGDAWRSAVGIAAQLYGSGQGLIVKVAKVPYWKDINSLGRQAAWDLIFKAETYSLEHHAALMDMAPTRYRVDTGEKRGEAAPGYI